MTINQADPGCEMFDRLCASIGFTADRVAEAAAKGEQRPDYRVVGGDGVRFVAEVKLITPNPVEADEIRRTPAGEVLVTGGLPGAKLRSLIDKANRQLKALDEEVPGVLVVFNAEFLLRRHTDPYAILTAMRGLDVVDVEVPRDPREAPRFGEVRSGPKKKMTAKINTSTSAIVCAHEAPDGGWDVHVYHNAHAARPLPARAIAGPRVIHSRMSEDEKSWMVIDVSRPSMSTPCYSPNDDT